MEAADAVGKKSALRCGLNATRLALSSAVTVLMVVVVVYAYLAVCRPGQLDLKVTAGTIQVKPIPPKLHLIFTVVAKNPSGRVRFYYTDIMGNVWLKNGTTYNVNFARFKLGMINLIVSPMSTLQTDADLIVKYYPPIATYFNELLYNGNGSSIIFDAMLQLNGTLTVELYSFHNKTSVQKVYYCWPLTMGTAGNTTADTSDDIMCGTYGPTKY